MTLEEYISTLIATLGQCDPDAYGRMCRVVGDRSARIRLDAQSVRVHMRDGVLRVESEVSQSSMEDSAGSTDTATVLALLRGDIEVAEAILNESLVVHGEIEQINRMFLAIEILLDAVPRCPALQKLSGQFVSEAPQSPAKAVAPRANWYRFAVISDELDFLNRYGLLPL
jgi:hypothetical protein